MSALSDDYEKRLKGCEIKPEKLKLVQHEVDRICAGRERYQAVVKLLPGIPWWTVGVLHSMECGLNFGQHLHNGDPLGARTVHVPKGRPLNGKPPFTWEESAVDALVCDGLDKIKDWGPGAALVAFENYNGTGYRRRGVPSPYLWSFTDQYRCGKYVADGRYDPQAVSQQCGCAALMKGLGVA